MEDHIQSNNWKYVETLFPGTKTYKSQIGVMRVLFGLHEDPEAVTTLVSRDDTQLWVMEKSSDWKRLF